MGKTIGAVTYLNSVPLVYGLEELAPEYRVIFDLPSRLCDRMAAGELQVGLVPVVEVVQERRWTIVGDACIACSGPVWSVKVLSRVPLGQIRTLAVDEGSRTSVILTRILLAEQYGVAPQLTTLKIDEPHDTTNTDAILLIGDRAMQADSAGFPVALDLGQAWRDWTGLPFVFAVWAASQQADIDYLATILGRARDWGEAHVTDIASRYAARYGLTAQQVEHYLTENLHYYLGESERRGLELFLAKAIEHGLLPPGAALKYGLCEVAR